MAIVAGTTMAATSSAPATKTSSATTSSSYFRPVEVVFPVVTAPAATEPIRGWVLSANPTETVWTLDCDTGDQILGTATPTACPLEYLMGEDQAFTNNPTMLQMTYSGPAALGTTVQAIDLSTSIGCTYIGTTAGVCTMASGSSTTTTTVNSMVLATSTIHVVSGYDKLVSASRIAANMTQFLSPSLPSPSSSSTSAAAAPSNIPIGWAITLLLSILGAVGLA
ncbi:MAG: hypothetical protein M1820_009966 [Bogoriella megaspora]|nr:MAG: hypothetical protein M1820_009966 [Bogoriella megaspora]